MSEDPTDIIPPTGEEIEARKIAERIIGAYNDMRRHDHNTSIIALNDERSVFLSLAIVDKDHLLNYLKRNNVPPSRAAAIVRNLTSKRS